MGMFTDEGPNIDLADALNKLDESVNKGWSYQMGYSHMYKAYICRIYKPRDRPLKHSSGTIYQNHVHGASGSTLTEAIDNALRSLDHG